MVIKPLYVIALFYFIILSCQNSKYFDMKSENDHVKKSQSEYDHLEFDKFFKKFHSDSLFQLSRIIFPLAGENIDGWERDSLWYKEDWTLHTNLQIDTSIYKEEFIYSDSLVKQIVFIEGSGFYVERHFKLINGEWYLVYYLFQNI